MKSEGSILLVDDTPENLRVLDDLLRCCYEVRVATNGIDALAGVHVSSPDLILLDCVMPGMSGAEVCRKLKEHPDFRRIPVIFISALGMTEHKLEAFREGAVDYITKPFHAEEVLARVRTHIDLGRLRQGLEEQVKKRTDELDQRNHDLQRVSERLQFATHVGTIGVWDWDVGNDILTWDDSMFALYGINKNDFLGAYDAWTKTIHPDDKDAAEEEIQEAIRGERSYSSEFRVVWPDGSIHYIKAEGRTFRNLEGKAIRMVGTNIDITAHKKSEEALRQSSLALEKKNEELERFLYTASHDLKTPVVTIRTFLGFLRKDMAGGDNAIIEKDLLYISAGSDKLAQLLDGLLEYSRIGRVENQPETVTFQALAEETILSAGGPIINLHANVTVHEPDLFLHGDRLRLVEILQNLIENACKFMGEQKDPRIDIGFESRAGETVFFVRDNGIGIDPRYLARVFTLFEKLDPKVEGTGLGLSLVKRIVELYDGSAWAESEGLGQGASFLFTLPGALIKMNEKEKI